MNRQREERHEEGQSLIIIGSLLVVLVALIGLVVDAGNAYAQRRILQNAVDAASMAGALELARQDDWKMDPTDLGLVLYNWQVINEVDEFAARNGADPDFISIYYADIQGNILKNARSQMIGDDQIDENTFGGVRAEAIIVEGVRDFPTYLVRVLGRTDMTAHATAMGVLACGACTAGGDGDDGLFPIAFDVNIFDNDDGFPDYGRSYNVWAKDPHNPGTGSFGYLSWNEDGGHTSNTTLIANMADTSRSGIWSVGDEIPTGPGVQTSSGVEQELKDRIDGVKPNPVILPIYTGTNGNGENLKYVVWGFGYFELECYHFSNSHYYSGKDDSNHDICDFDNHDNSKWIQGKFVQGVAATSSAGCTNYGVCTATTTTGLEVKRVLAGQVTPWQITPEQNAGPGAPNPVDVVHVVDISGSMCANWNGSGGGSPCTDQGRLAVAKDVLEVFNNALDDPAAYGLGDWDPGNENRVGLATYPTIASSYSYNTDCGVALGRKCTTGPATDCGKSTNAMYFARKDRELTTGIGGVNAAIQSLVANGGTSMPRGLQYGRELVTEDGTNTSGNQQVLILTTDGMANIKIDGKWTGYLGNYPNPYWIDYYGCNDSVYQAAIEQANMAKQAGVIVFTIGIHENIDTDLLTAIATADTNPEKPHFFLAHTQDDFEYIYQSILARLPQLGNEECTARENAVVGAGAWVYLYDDNGNQVAITRASSTGDYIFEDIEPGDYELRASWLDPSSGIEYNVMTWTLGGAPAEQPIMVEVPLGMQTTEMNLYLRTDYEFVCGE